MPEVLFNQEVLKALHLAGQQLVNAGADEKEVTRAIKKLAPLYRTELLPVKKQGLLELAPAAAKARQRGLPKLAPVAAKAKQQVKMPKAQSLNMVEQALIEVALGTVSPGLSSLLTLARVIAGSKQVTIGFGPQGGAGIVANLSAGFGVCLFPNGRMGYYGAFSSALGVIGSISATIQYTIVSGGKENFGGSAFIAGVTGGEMIVGNAAALLSVPKCNFLGITAGVGFGAGIPFEIFAGAQKTWVK